MILYENVNNCQCASKLYNQTVIQRVQNTGRAIQKNSNINISMVLSKSVFIHIISGTMMEYLLLEDMAFENNQVLNYEILYP